MRNILQAQGLLGKPLAPKLLSSVQVGQRPPAVFQNRLWLLHGHSYPGCSAVKRPQQRSWSRWIQVLGSCFFQMNLAEERKKECLLPKQSLWQAPIAAKVPASPCDDSAEPSSMDTVQTSQVHAEDARNKVLSVDSHKQMWKTTSFVFPLNILFSKSAVFSGSSHSGWPKNIIRIWRRSYLVA